MFIPQELADVLKLAYESVLSNSKGELILPIRKKIWTELGEYKLNNKDALYSVGLKRRTKLASLCVSKVSSIWGNIEPNDQRPLKMLEIADKYILGGIGYESACERLNDFLNDLVNLAAEERFFYVVEVGFASCKALDIALHDETLLIYGKDNCLDSDLDSFSWDSSFYASIAFSGSGPWDSTNIEKRQEFWLWYINEAVPKAYSSFME